MLVVIMAGKEKASFLPGKGFWTNPVTIENQLIRTLKQMLLILPAICLQLAFTPLVVFALPDKSSPFANGISTMDLQIDCTRWVQVQTPFKELRAMSKDESPLADYSAPLCHQFLFYQIQGKLVQTGESNGYKRKNGTEQVVLERENNPFYPYDVEKAEEAYWLLLAKAEKAAMNTMVTCANNKGKTPKPPMGRSGQILQAWPGCNSIDRVACLNGLVN